MEKKKIILEPIELRPLVERVLSLKIEGTNILYIHRISKKYEQQLIKQAAGKPKQTQKGVVRDFDAEFIGSLYYLDSKGHEVAIPKKITPKMRFGFPASGFKKAMVSACLFYKSIKKAEAKQLFFIEGQFVEIKGIPAKDEFLCRIGGKGPGTGTPAIGIRAKFMKWMAVISIRFCVDAISASSIINLLSEAGKHVGIGEDRPGKSGNNFGTWKLL